MPAIVLDSCKERSVAIQAYSDSGSIDSNTSITYCKRMIMISCLVVTVVGLLVGLLTGLLMHHSTSTTYRAAAVQYFPYQNSTNAQLLLQVNLASYADIISQANLQSVDVILFPEGGLGYMEAENTFSNNATLAREALLLFCEAVPSPASHTDACSQLTAAANPQLHTLACSAKQNKLTVVVNLCQYEQCSPGQSAESFLSQSPYKFAQTPCPADGYYFWNTNVVFGPDGSIVAVYAKAHLYDTLSFDGPNAVPVSFTSSFGVTFGTFIGFDVEFASPQNALLVAGVQHWLFPSWWTSQAPQLTSTMIQAAWAERWGVNLIAANALNLGGGIFQAGAKHSIQFDPLTPPIPGEFVMVIDDLLKQLPYHAPPLTDPNTPLSAFPTLPPTTSNTVTPCSVTSISEEGNCAFLQPTSAQQSLSVSHGDVQCKAVLTPVTSEANVSFVSSYTLFASQNSFVEDHTPSSLFLESCFVMRCVGLSIEGQVQCGTDYLSTVAFSELRILAGLNCTRFGATVQDGGAGEEGTGPAGTVLPMLASGLANIEDNSHYNFEYVGKFEESCWWSITLSETLQMPLFSMGFYGVDGQSN